MKKTKKELRQEATKLANRMHHNLSNANNVENLLQAIPTLAVFTSLQANFQGKESAVNIRFYNSAKALPEKTLDACLDLFKANMSEMYEESSWGLDMKAKRNELTHPNARYIIATKNEGEKGNDNDNGNGNDSNGNDEILAFAHFRFEGDDDDQPTREVLYLYELQINVMAQRNGLGKRMMQILEIVGMQMQMRCVMLTVFKKNTKAFLFYEKLKYKVDEISPSKFGEEADYEIMSKCVYKG